MTNNEVDKKERQVGIHYRLLTLKDKVALDMLTEEVESYNHSIGIAAPFRVRDTGCFFDESQVLIWGCFDGNELVGASSLFLNPSEFSPVAKYLGLSSSAMAEIGRCMVSPRYRGQNILFTLNRLLFDCAEEHSVHKIVAVVRPENNAIAQSLKKLGMFSQGTMVRENGDVREIYYWGSPCGLS